MATIEPKKGWAQYLEPEIAVWVPVDKRHNEVRGVLQQIKDNPDVRSQLVLLGKKYQLPYLDIYPFELDPESHGGEIGIALGSDAERLDLTLSDCESISIKVAQILKTQTAILIHPQFNRLPKKWDGFLGSIPPSTCIMSDNAIIIGGR
ncbi:MAG: hypothetical protein ACOYNL_10830 [Rickettsiales bacterium]